jgi:toluene monooxygenase system protein B
MAVITLSMLFEGDYAIYLLPADSEQTMADVAALGASWEIPARIVPRPGCTLRVRRHGSEVPFPTDMKVGESGLVFMDPIDVYFE